MVISREFGGSCVIVSIQTAAVFGSSGFRVDVFGKVSLSTVASASG